uniref:SsuA/THI5-like domain-containing protein n=1 Tax=candidate division WOR-3 bacterium TaxID=2052148 RepID=A0A7C4TBW5_UNCW3
MSIRATEKILNVLIFIGILVLLFVVGYPQYKEAQPVHIRFGVDKSFGSLPFYVAKLDTSRRYYELERIAPEFVDVGDNPLEELKSGKYDVVAVPWYSLLLSPAINGDTVKAVCSIELKAISDAIILPKGTKIKLLKDLNNKRIGLLKSDEYLFDLIFPELAFEKLTAVKKVLLAPEEIPTALADGKVDALYLLEPYRSYIIHQGDTAFAEGFVYKYISTTMPYLAIVMRKSFVQGNRSAAYRLKNALDGVFGFLRVHPEVGKSTLLEIKGWAKDEILLSNIRMPEYNRLTEVDFKSIENYQAWLVRRGIGTCGMKPQEFFFEKTDFKR